MIIGKLPQEERASFSACYMEAGLVDAIRAQHT